MATEMTEEEARRYLEQKYGREYAAEAFGDTPPPDGTPAAPAGPALPENPTSEQAREYLLAKGWSEDQIPDKPVPKSMPYSEPTMLNKAKHLAKGVGEAARGIVELPYELEMLGYAATDALGITDPNDPNSWRSTRPASEAVVDTLAGEGTYARGREALAGEVLTPEQAPVIDALRTGVEWTAGGLPNAFRRGAREIVPDVIAGAGAMAGEQGERYISGTDTGLGEGGGGMSAMLINALRGRGTRLGSDAQAVQNIQRMMEDPETALATMRQNLAEGEVGTTADLSRDQGAFDAEAAASADREFQRRLQEEEQKRAASLTEQALEPLPQADTQTSIESARARTEARSDAIEQGRRSRRDTIEEALAADEARAAEEAAAAEARRGVAEADITAAEGEVAQAQEALTEAERAVAPTTTTDQASREMYETIYNTEKALQDEVITPAYDEFKKSGQIQVNPMTAAMTRSLNSLPAEQRGQFMEEFGKKLQIKGGWELKNSTSAENVADYLQRLRTLAYEVDDPIKGPTMGQKALRNIIAAAEKELGGRNELFKAAKEETRKKYQRFRQDRMAGARKAEPEEFARALRMEGDSGAVAARMITDADIPDLSDRQVVEYLRAKAAQSGGVDEAFVNKHRAFFNALPEERVDEFFEAASARTGLTQTEKAAKDSIKRAETEIKAADTELANVNRGLEQSRKRAEEQIRDAGETAQGLEKSLTRNVVTRYGDAQDPGTFVRKLAETPEGSKDLGRLMRYMDAAGEGDSFRTQIRNQVEGILNEKQVIEGKTSPKKDADIKRMVGNLRRSGVIDEGQATEMLDRINRSKTVDQRAASVKAILPETDAEMQNLIASGASAALLQGLGGTQSLLLGGAVRRKILRTLQFGKQKNAEVEAIENLLLDPERFLREADRLEEIKRIETEADAMKVVELMMDDAIKRLGTASRVGQAADALNEEDM